MTNSVTKKMAYYNVKGLQKMVTSVAKPIATFATCRLIPICR